MARLPIPGSDDGTWGTILNNFLDVSHNQDGTLIPSAVAATGAEQTVNKGKPGGYAALDASANVPTSQLGNVPPAPIKSVAGKTGVVTLAETDIANLTTDLSAKAPLASPAFTGTPTAPTQTALTNNTDIATTAYTDTAVGVETTRAEAAEATKLALAGGTMTGPIVGFEDKGGQVFNVKAYGAKGDGSTNDTAAIQNAVNAANSSGGGVVYFPPGTYVISGDPALSIPGGVSLVGSGIGSTTLQIAVATGTTSYVGIQLGNGSSGSTMQDNFRISDLTLDGNERNLGGNYGSEPPTPSHNFVVLGRTNMLVS